MRMVKSSNPAVGSCVPVRRPMKMSSSKPKSMWDRSDIGSRSNVPDETVSRAKAGGARANPAIQKSMMTESIHMPERQLSSRNATSVSVRVVRVAFHIDIKSFQEGHV